jgi:dipeptide/tripeptide permease
LLLLVVAGIYYDPVHQALQAELTPRSVRGRIIMLWSLGNAVASAIGGLVGRFVVLCDESCYYS